MEDPIPGKLLKFITNSYFYESDERFIFRDGVLAFKNNPVAVRR
jgi:hypothetical protein